MAKLGHTFKDFIINIIVIIIIIIIIVIVIIIKTPSYPLKIKKRTNK